MSYTLPNYDAVNFTSQGESAYTLPNYNNTDFEFLPSLAGNGSITFVVNVEGYGEQILNAFVGNGEITFSTAVSSTLNVGVFGSGSVTFNTNLIASFLTAGFGVPENKLVIPEQNSVVIQQDNNLILNQQVVDVNLPISTTNYIIVCKSSRLKNKEFNYTYTDGLVVKNSVDIFYENGLPTGVGFSCLCQTNTKNLLANKSFGTIWEVDGTRYTGNVPSSFNLIKEDGSSISVPFTNTVIVVSEDYTEYNVERRLLIKFTIPGYCKYFYNFLDLTEFDNPEYISNLYASYLDFCDTLIYFTSEVYPIYFSDDITANATWISGYQWMPPEDWLNASCTLVAGALTPTVSYGSYTNYGNINWNTIYNTGLVYCPANSIPPATCDLIFNFNNSKESEWLESSANLVSGNLIVIVSYKSYLNFGAIVWDNIFDFNNSANAEWLMSSCLLTGGSMVVTAGYITYSNYEPESLESSCTLVSGSLT